MINKIKDINKIGCIICQNPELAEMINEHLINATMSPAMLKEHLEDVNGIYLSVKVIEEHSKHLFTILKDDVNRDVAIEGTFKYISGLKNIELVNKEIAKMDYIASEMITNKSEDGVAFNNIMKLKQKYIELKIKIEGEDTLVIEHKVPEWIKIRDE